LYLGGMTLELFRVIQSLAITCAGFLRLCQRARKPGDSSFNCDLLHKHALADLILTQRLKSEWDEREFVDIRFGTEVIFFRIATRHNARPALVNFLLRSGQPCSRIRHRTSIFIDIVIVAPRRAFIASQDHSYHFSIGEHLQALYCTEAYQHVLVLNPPFAPYALRDVDSSHICKFSLHPTLQHSLKTWACQHLLLPFRSSSGCSSDRVIRDRFSLLF
jgi:hypothetical protein